MPNSSKPDTLRHIIGISDTSARKSYYPILQRTIAELRGEIAERHKAEAALRATVERIERHQRAMTTLVSFHSLGAPEKALPMVCATLAQALDVHRVTIWRLEENQAIPIASNEELPPSWEHRDVAFVSSLGAELTLRVEDALAHPETQALWRHLGHNAPGALLASSIYHNNGCWGMVSCEHGQGPRAWFADEIAFCGRMAEHIAFILSTQEIQRLRKLLANMVDSMPSSLITVDRNGTVTQWNQHASHVFGIPASQAIGHPLAHTAPHLQRYLDLVHRALEERCPQCLLRQARSDGEQILYEDITIYPLVTNGIEGAVIRVDDVTERQRMEQMLIQSEKMLSVGGLAAGMAHEINNPLASILGNAQVMARRLLEPLPANVEAAAATGIDFEKLQAYLTARGIPAMLGAIQEAGRRAATLVTNMLGFSRKGDDRLRLIDLEAVLRATVELASTDYDLKKNYDFRKVHIQWEVAPGLPAVPCAESKIQQVLLNLLRNSAEAMREKTYGPGEEPQITLRLTGQEGWARLEVEDNGPGMDDAVRARAFEPFFTTKPPGKGTGLGLSVSYYIITQEHHGRIHVESTPGQGTRFRIELPVEAGPQKP
jgi:PAS domain S-box-containing protein